MFGFRFLISYPTENNYSNLVSKFDNVSSQLKAFNSGYRHDNKSMDALQNPPPKKTHKKQINQAWSEAIPSSGACSFKEEVKNVSSKL